MGVAVRGRAPSARQERQTTLTEKIYKIHTASRETYGAPWIHAELRTQNVPCCRNTVAKLMRQASIMPKCIRRFRVTTDSRWTKALPNLIGRVFTTDRPNACSLSDITYIPTRAGWLYLATMLDAYSRARPPSLTGVDMTVDRMRFTKVCEVLWQGYDRWACQVDQRTGHGAILPRASSSARAATAERA
jgi:transposase InsO family protein